MKRTLLLLMLWCGTTSASPYQVATHDETVQVGSRSLVSRIYYPTTETRSLPALRVSRTRRQQVGIFR